MLGHILNLLKGGNGIKPATVQDGYTANWGGPSGRVGGKVQTVKLAQLATIAAIAVMAITLAAPAHADPDTDFANQLHTYGIYGPRDYNAWIGKIVCERLHNGVDADAYKSQKFVTTNLPRGSTEVQAWQFLGTAITYYCPDQTPVLESVSAHHS